MILKNETKIKAASSTQLKNAGIKCIKTFEFYWDVCLQYTFSSKCAIIVTPLNEVLFIEKYKRRVFLKIKTLEEFCFFIERYKKDGKLSFE